jgi:hypothetical protein
MRALTALGASLLVGAAAFAGCTGVIGDGFGEGGPGGPGSKTFAPGAATLHRLTSVQLQQSYLALFGEPFTVPADLPDDDQLYGFTSISAASRTISPLDAEKYEAAAYEAIAQVWDDAARREELVGCAPSSMSDGCLRSFLEDFGLRAWRRPLEDSELDALVAVGQAAANQFEGDAWEGLRFTLGALLQSPHFLFRVEVGAPEGGLLRFTDFEMASRLSYVLTDGPPDEALLAAAQSGELADPARLRVHAQRLLESDAAKPALMRFFRDFMNIGRLDELDKSSELFPQLTPTLGASMQSEIELMFAETVFESEGDFRQLFTTRDTFLNEELARIYGIEGVTGPELVPTTLPDDGRRGGLLTTPGFLALNAHKTATSPTHRGRFVRINLLCEDVPPPPPGVDTTLPELEPGAPAKTLRQRLEKHREDPACQSCHAMMDPIGFGLEHYDAVGSWRDSDDGLPIDDATELDGTPFSGGVELGELVAEMPAVGSCIARRFYQHANGRLDESSEKRAVEKLVSDFVASDYNFKELVIATVLNDGFRYASPPETEEE